MTTGDGHVPVTVQGTMEYPGGMVVIGEQYFDPSSNAQNSYWFLVVDLTSLKVVTSTVSAANDQVPPDVQQFAGNPQYLLILTTLVLRTDNLPQGALYQFLQSIGSGPMLARAEQINEQLGTGTIGAMSYILAATMDTGDGKGFEEFSFTDLTILTFELMPVTINGQTIYTPIQTGM